MSSGVRTAARPHLQAFSTMPSPFSTRSQAAHVLGHLHKAQSLLPSAGSQNCILKSLGSLPAHRNCPPSAHHGTTLPSPSYPCPSHSAWKAPPSYGASRCLACESLSSSLGKQAKAFSSIAAALTNAGQATTTFTGGNPPAPFTSSTSQLSAREPATSSHCIGLTHEAESLTNPTGSHGPCHEPISSHSQSSNSSEPSLNPVQILEQCPETSQSGEGSILFISGNAPAAHYDSRLIKSGIHTRVATVRIPSDQSPLEPSESSLAEEEDCMSRKEMEAAARLPLRIPRRKGMEPEVLLNLEAVYPELNLKPIQDQVGGVRVRQHANPLASSLMNPAEPPRWEEVFADPTLPLHLDIGCGSGRFLLVLAKRNSGSRNFLGLEIRHKLVERSQGWTQELNLQNIHFLFANANSSLPSLLDTYPGKLVYVSVLCPDPHFKTRHRKRRVVQPDLVRTIAKYLVSDGKLFLASDVKEVAMDMRSQFELYGKREFAMRRNDNTDLSRDSEGWLLESPLGVPTEREIAVLTKGGSMYRVVYERL